ncbi:hypothetical protein [Bacillus mesophilum]|nr:hypothetical protein [Bacillus mesophilum]
MKDNHMEDKDILHHLLEEQIAYILVDEERERAKIEHLRKAEQHDISK